MNIFEDNIITVIIYLKKNINTITIQIDNNSTNNDMLFRELILLFQHA